jgi:hypothetical protein
MLSKSLFQEFLFFSHDVKMDTNDNGAQKNVHWMDGVKAGPNANDEATEVDRISTKPVHTVSFELGVPFGKSDCRGLPELNEGHEDDGETRRIEDDANGSGYETVIEQRTWT